MPYTLPFNPLCSVIPLGALFWGPAGIMGAAAGMLAGDVVSGMVGPLSFFRLVATISFGLMTHQLWEIHGRHKNKTRHAADRSHTLRFLFVSLLASLWYIAVMAFGTEVLNLYPFTYTASLLLLQHFLFIPAIGGWLYPALVRAGRPGADDWGDIMGKPPIRAKPSFAKTVVVWSAGTACTGGGLLLSYIVYGLRPFTPYILGVKTGKALLVLVLPLLVFMLLLAIADLSATQLRKKR